jgi:hypothetical protein
MGTDFQEPVFSLRRKMLDRNQDNISCSDCQLRSLCVLKSADYRLIELPPESQIYDSNPDFIVDGGAIGPLAWGLWVALLVIPFVVLFLMGFFAGGF